MDHSYLEATVAPILTEALALMSKQLAGTYASTNGMPHPTLDPIDFIGQYLLKSLNKTDTALFRDLEMRYGVRDAALHRAFTIRAQQEAEMLAEANATYNDQEAVQGELGPEDANGENIAPEGENQENAAEGEENQEIDPENENETNNPDETTLNGPAIQEPEEQES
jgi:hypothetical protein